MRFCGSHDLARRATMTDALAPQGTGLGVGQSLLVVGLDLAAKRRGASMAPFESQNMSNDAAMTADDRGAGSHLHGAFRDGGSRSAWPRSRGAAASASSCGHAAEAVLDGLAEQMEEHRDVAGDSAFGGAHTSG